MNLGKQEEEEMDKLVLLLNLVRKRDEGRMGRKWAKPKELRCWTNIGELP